MAIKKYAPWLAIAIGLVAFITLGYFVGRESTLAFDTTVLREIYTYKSPFLDNYFEVLTYAGDPQILGAIGIIIAAILVQRKKAYLAAVVALLFAGSGLITSVSKELYVRARPELWERPAYESSFSFPSGHAATSMIIVCTLLFLLWGYTRMRTLMLIAGAAFLVLIAVSRLYLGVHYPSDIIGGWILSLTWFGLILTIYRAFERTHRRGAANS